MKLRFTNQFEKQFDKISDKRIRSQIVKAIQELKDSPHLSAVSTVKKLKGFRNAYRIRSGNYRIGFFTDNEDILTIAHVDIRGSFYRKFP